MRRRGVWLAKRLMIILTSLLVTAIVLEVCLRLFVPVTDWPLSEFDPQVGLHRAPNQTGTWVVGFDGEVQGHYRINAQGWNSIHDYVNTRAPNDLRIAVIGDSFVEALQVDVDKNFMSLTEQALKASDACAHYDAVEVYSFGMGGAPMSQYVAMMRYAAAKYAPDVFIVNLYPVNDFDQSLTEYAPDVYSYFMTYHFNESGRLVETPPSPYTPSGTRRFLENFALVRYLYGNLRLEDVIRQVVREESPFLDLENELTAVMRRGFADMQQVAQASDSPLLLVMDADRLAIYGAAEPSPQIAMGSHIATDTAAGLGIDLIDLTDAFTRDFQAYGQRFEFSVDDHWNGHGHAVVSHAISGWIEDHVCGGEEVGTAGPLRTRIEGVW